MQILQEVNGVEGMNRFFQDMVERSEDIFTLVDKDLWICYTSSGDNTYGADPTSLRLKSIFPTR
ncbi:MAG: hypothetical protein ACK4RF_11160 [Cyclobacteriaceae bacterium]